MAGGAAGAALLTGCSGDGAPGTAAAGGSAAAGRLRARAHRESAALLARYDATLAAHPGLAERLRPLRAETARHLAAFAGPGPSATSGSAGGSASAAPGSGRPAAPAAPPRVPERPGEALAALARAERETADARTTALAGAPAEFARLLASVAACGAAHAFLLTGGGS
ncbi:hypothetical protein IHE55_21945 [Streptomyces pactum]|uniref:Lipoprotein n=1 Tax=Streptomyces pactum TaxID=68249 RepID=A0ABS0NQ09_9ACTN|nr:hypothetical protein [Streptomyces pactum]